MNKNDILSIIRNLNASKAHGWDKISIWMITLCGKTMAIPLKLIFRSMLEQVVLGMLFQSTKETIKTWLKIIDFSVFFLFSVKVLKDLYLIPCSIILYKTNYSLRVNLASFQAIRMLFSSYQLRMKSTKYLIVIHHMIWEGTCLIFRKHLTMFGTKF